MQNSSTVHGSLHSEHTYMGTTRDLLYTGKGLTQGRVGTMPTVQFPSTLRDQRIRLIPRLSAGDSLAGNNAL